MAVKNSKTRPKDNPYQTWVSNDGLWQWDILKFWSNDLTNPYARVFCSVSSPYADELGDVYYSEIVKHATLVYQDEAMEV